MIQADYSQQEEKFSLCFKKVFYEFIGKLMYEVSEGVEGDIGFLKEIFIKKQVQYLERIGFNPMQNQLTNTINSFWENIRVEYEKFKRMENEGKEEEILLKELD